MTAPSNKLTVIQNGQPSWATVRSWISHVAMLENCKLFCQVMVGFELIALRKEYGITHGGDRKSGNRVSGLTWPEILKKESGLSESTAYNLIDMARAATPRLKKHPILKTFVPGETSLNALPSAQKEALEQVVKKLTDNSTQCEFFERLGIWKNFKHREGLGRRPGEGGKRRLSLAEQKELLVRHAEEHWFHPREGISVSIITYGIKFTVLNDMDVEAQLGVLERAAKARRAWLKQPRNQRDAESIECFFESGCDEFISPKTDEQKPKSPPKGARVLARLYLPSLAGRRVGITSAGGDGGPTFHPLDKPAKRDGAGRPLKKIMFQGQEIEVAVAEA